MSTTQAAQLVVQDKFVDTLHAFKYLHWLIKLACILHLCIFLSRIVL